MNPSWTVILLCAILMLEVALVVGLIVVYRTNARLHRVVDSLYSGEDLRQGLRRFDDTVEKRVDLLYDDLQTQLEALASRPRDDRASVAEAKPPATLSPLVKPTAMLPNNGTYLETWLDDPDFRRGVWDQLDRPRRESLTILRRFLHQCGASSAEIQVIPNEENHWRFFVIGRPSGDEVRIVVPRHFQRYDPTYLDHLFEVHGKRHFGSNLRRLDRCALVEAGERIDGADIPKQVVKRRGIVTV